jgi:hypothetical protein
LIYYSYGPNALDLNSTTPSGLSGMSITYDVDFQPLYYSLFLWDSTGLESTLLASDAFHFATPGGNAAGYLQFHNQTCNHVKYELGNSENSTVFFINANIHSKYAFQGPDMLVGMVNSTSANSAIMQTYEGTHVIKSTFIAFCSSVEFNTSDSECDSTPTGTMNVPAGGAGFFVSYPPANNASSSGVMYFTPNGWFGTNGDDW